MKSCADDVRPDVVVRTLRKLGFDAQRADGAAWSRGSKLQRDARIVQGRPHAMLCDALAMCASLAGRWARIRGRGATGADFESAGMGHSACSAKKRSQIGGRGAGLMEASWRPGVLGPVGLHMWHVWQVLAGLAWFGEGDGGRFQLR